MPLQTGYVQSRKSSQAIIFAHEALHGGAQTYTVELETVGAESGVKLDEEYCVKWTRKLVK